MMHVEDSLHPEFDAMYGVGLPVSQIVELTGARAATIHRHIEGRRAIDPSLALARAAAPRGPTKVWRKHFAELRNFLATYGGFPAAHGPEAGEPRLYRWLSEQRCALVAQTLGWAKMEAMTPLGDWTTTDLELERDRRWRARLGQVVQFWAEHGRLPRLASAKDEPEHSLAIWIATQHNATLHRHIPAERLAALNQALPGWRKER